MTREQVAEVIGSYVLHCHMVTEDTMVMVGPLPDRITVEFEMAGPANDLN